VASSTWPDHPDPLPRSTRGSNGTHPAERPRAEIGDGKAPNGARPLGSAPLLPDWPADAAERHPDGHVAGAISTGVVGLLRERTGRGPTKAKTIVSSDLVVITLADCLTTAERQLAGAGHGDLVARTRSVLHEGMRAAATGIVEEHTNRQVNAYLTAQHQDPDLAILVFYLAPARLTVA
jgi:uncharacterized protein YbcI